MTVLPELVLLELLEDMVFPAEGRAAAGAAGGAGAVVVLVALLVVLAVLDGVLFEGISRGDSEYRSLFVKVVVER